MRGGQGGCSEEEVRAASAALEAPDPGSRSGEEEGRRVVAESVRTLGPMQYRVVNGYKYRMMPGEEKRKAGERKRSAKYYAKKKAEREAAEWDRHDLDAPLAVQRPMKVGEP